MFVNQCEKFLIMFIIFAIKYHVCNKVCGNIFQNKVRKKKGWLMAVEVIIMRPWRRLRLEREMNGIISTDWTVNRDCGWAFDFSPFFPVHGTLSLQSPDGAEMSKKLKAPYSWEMKGCEGYLFFSNKSGEKLEQVLTK